MNRNRVFNLVAFLILASGIYWLLSDSKKIFVDKAKDSEIISILNSYGLAEESYFKSYGEFSVDEEKLGLTLSAKNLDRRVFFSKDSIPLEYLSVLPETSYPLVTKKSYRILLADKNKSGVELWIVDEKKEPVKLKEFFEVK